MEKQCSNCKITTFCTETIDRRKALIAKQDARLEGLEQDELRLAEINASLAHHMAEFGYTEDDFATDSRLETYRTLLEASYDRIAVRSMQHFEFRRVFEDSVAFESNILEEVQAGCTEKGRKIGKMLGAVSLNDCGSFNPHALIMRFEIIRSKFKKKTK